MKTFSFVWLVGLLAALVCVAESRAQPKARPDVYGEFDETEADVDVSSPQQKVHFLAEPDNVTTRLGERIVGQEIPTELQRMIRNTNSRNQIDMLMLSLCVVMLAATTILTMMTIITIRLPATRAAC